MCLKSAPFIYGFCLSSKEPDSFSSPIFCSCFKFCKMSSAFFPRPLQLVFSVELKGTLNYISE